MPNPVNFLPSTIGAKNFANFVKVLASGLTTVVDARGMSLLTITTEAASTATYSRVLTATASVDSSPTAQNGAVDSATKVSFAVDFPFYRITAGGTGYVNIMCV